MSKTSRTNPIGAGTKNVPVNMPLDLANRLAELAQRSGMSTSAYCAAVLQEAAEQGLVGKAIVTFRASAPVTGPYRIPQRGSVLNEEQSSTSTKPTDAEKRAKK